MRTTRHLVSRRWNAGLLFALSAFPVAATTAGASSLGATDALAESYIVQWKSFYPTAALAAGDTASASAFEDYSAERVADWIVVNRETLRQLESRPPTLDLDERIDRRILTRQVRLELERWETGEAAQARPAVYAGAISQALTHVLARDDLDPEGKVQALRVRLQGMARLADTGRRQLRRGGTAAVARSGEVLAATAAFLRSRLPGVAADWLEPGEDSRFETLCLSTAEAAERLASHLGDVETVSDVIGGHDYARRLATYTDSDLEPQRLAELAREEITEVRGRIAALATTHWQQERPDAPLPHPDERVAAAIEAMEANRVGDQEAFKEQFVTLTRRAEEFVRDQGLASVPEETTLIVALSPPHFAGASVGGVYPAGPFNPDADTLFYLPSVPDEAPEARREGFYRSFNDHFNAMIVPHEMFPGHYLQLKLASRNPHLVRSLFASSLHAEGWATLCERLALDAGWDDRHPLSWLAHLRKRLENATRAYVSVQVHCQGWDQERLEEFAVREGLLAPQFAVNLWHRVIASPFQLTSYFLGNRAFEALYETERERQGEGFQLRGFSDRILEVGAAPLDELPRLFDEDEGEESAARPPECRAREAGLLTD